MAFGVTLRGMRITISEDNRVVFREMDPSQLTNVLVELSASRKHFQAPGIVWTKLKRRQMQDLTAAVQAYKLISPMGSIV